MVVQLTCFYHFGLMDRGLSFEMVDHSRWRKLTSYVLKCPVTVSWLCTCLLHFWEQSGCLPPMWPGFDFQPQCHVGWVCWFSSLLWEVFPRVPAALIAQLVEHRSGIAERRVWIPVQACRNCKSLTCSLFLLWKAPASVICEIIQTGWPSPLLLEALEKTATLKSWLLSYLQMVCEFTLWIVSPSLRTSVKLQLDQ